MNVAQLQPPTLPQVSEKIAKDAGETEANVRDDLIAKASLLKHFQFLALRLLNKRARVRLSPEQLDLDPLPGQARLFAVANSKGCFVAIARDSSSTWCESLSSVLVSQCFVGRRGPESSYPNLESLQLVDYNSAPRRRSATSYLYSRCGALMTLTDCICRSHICTTLATAIGIHV